MGVWMKVSSIAKGTFISSHDTLEEAQKARKELVRTLPKVTKAGSFEFFCEPYQGIWAVFMYKNLTKGTSCLSSCGNVNTWDLTMEYVSNAKKGTGWNVWPLTVRSISTHGTMCATQLTVPTTIPSVVLGKN